MYILIKNNKIEKYPYSKTDLIISRRDISFSNVVTDETAAEYGVFPVQVLPEPQYDAETQTVERDTPFFEDGQWKQPWTIRDLTDQELEDRKQQHNNNIKAQIFSLEAQSLMPRPVREMLLATDGPWQEKVLALDTQIANLRSQLK